MKKINAFVLSLIFYTLTGFRISLTIMANIGVSSYNALNLSLANLFSLKIGTMTIIVNSLFLIWYIILTKGKNYQSYLMQAVSVFSLGYVINFFTYQLLGNIHLTSYPAKLALFILGATLAGIGTGMVLNLKTLAFPIESVCDVLAKKGPYSFSQLRYSVDIFSVLISVTLSLLLGDSLFVREGTLISLLLLSFVISTTKKMYDELFSQSNRLI